MQHTEVVPVIIVKSVYLILVHVRFWCYHEQEGGSSRPWSHPLTFTGGAVKCVIDKLFHGFRKSIHTENFYTATDNGNNRQSFQNPGNNQVIPYRKALSLFASSITDSKSS